MDNNTYVQFEKTDFENIARIMRIMRFIIN